MSRLRPPIYTKVRGIIILFCLLLTLPAHAGLWEDFESPVTTDAHWVLLGGTALTLATAAAHSSSLVDYEDQTATKKPLGSSSKFGDTMGQLVPNALYAGGMGIAYYFEVPRAGERTMLMVEATLYSALVTNVLKYSIREPRPNSTQRNSFPSGHATTAFAFAGAVACEHGWWYGVPAMGLATFVAYSRINDNEHRVHDVIAGATVGLSYAYGIYYAHQRTQNAVTFLPEPLPGGAALNVAWGFQ